MTAARTSRWLAILAVLAVPASAQAATRTVGMGLPPSAQKQFNQTYNADVDQFFPRGVTIHAGDSVRFAPDAFHTVDLPKRGGKPLDLVANLGTTAGVADATGDPFWFNGQPVVGFAPALSVAAFGKTLTYTGAKRIDSGAPFSDKPKPFTVRFPKTGTYTFYCDIHAGMKGKVKVVRRSTKIPSAKSVSAAVKKQLAGTLAVAKRFNTTSAPAGVVNVGLSDGHGVEYYGFVPNTLNVPAGTTVTFKMPASSEEVHTASTGPGDPDKDQASYLGTLAQGLQGDKFDSRAIYPSTQPGSPSTVDPTSHGNGFWSSGVMDTLSATPFPTSGAVTFTAPGTYQFYCLIHTFMHATVNVT